MRRAMLILSAALLVTTTAGCVDPPRFFNPGPLGYQRQQAHRYDPYPTREEAPSFAGSRPPAYNNQPPEPSRARWQSQGWR